MNILSNELYTLKRGLVKCLGLVHWDVPEGWVGEGGRRDVNPWLIHVNVWQKPLQCCKVISPQLIKIKEKKKKKKKEGSYNSM